MKKLTLNPGRLLVMAGFALIPLLSADAYRFGDVEMHVNAGINGKYDDNITYANRNKKADFSNVVSLGVNARYEGKLRSAEMRANVYRETFNKNSKFNNTSEDFTFNFFNEFSRFARLTLTDFFSHSYDPQSFEDEFGRVGGRYSTYSNRFNGVYSRDVTKQLMVNLRYTNNLDAYSRSDLSNSMLNRMGFGAEYAFTSKSIVLGSYDFARRGYESGGSIRTNTLTGGLRHYFTSQLFTEAKAGVDFINTLDSTNYTKPLFIVSLNDDLDTNSRLSISFTKEYYSNSYSRDLFNHWQGSGNFTRQLSERLGFVCSAFYGEGEYMTSDIKDKLKGAQVGLNYDLKEDIRGTLRYSYSRTDSNDDNREYTRNAVNLGLRMTF